MRLSDKIGVYVCVACGHVRQMEHNDVTWCPVCMDELRATTEKDAEPPCEGPSCPRMWCPSTCMGPCEVYNVWSAKDLRIGRNKERLASKEVRENGRGKEKENP